MRRGITTLLLLLMLSALACGKYGPPERVSGPPTTNGASDEPADEKRKR